MRRAAAIAALLLFAGCTEPARVVDAVIDADLEAGEATFACRDSSSGTCHALFVTEATTITAQAAKGATAQVQGLGPFTRYCVDVVAPRTSGCRPLQLQRGQQIVRSSAVD